MKLTVFGPTGGTGEQIVRQALQVGHTVTAVARRPEAMRMSDPALHVVAGDVFDPEALSRPLYGADAVLCALGSRDPKRPTTVQSAGTAAILTAMQAAGVRRIIAISAAPVAPVANTTAVERQLLHPLLYRFFGGGYDDMRRMENLLADSDSDWTVFRPPRLTNKPGTGRFRTAVDKRLPRASSIPRGNLAAAVLDAAADDSLAGHAVSIAT